MASLTDFYNYDSKSGIIIPDTSNVRDAVVNVFKNAFGDEVSISPETHIGRLIDGLTEGFKSCVGLNAQNASQFNPNYATGVWLDNVAALFNMTRKGAQPTVVTATITGIANTFIPAGSLAETVKNNQATGILFATKEDVTIDLNGQASVIMECTQTGAIECAAGTLNKIVSSINGWQTVNNLIAGTIGRDNESDNEFRTRILNGRAFGIGPVDAIYQAVSSLDAVKSLCVLENGKASEETKNGVALKAHCVYICADFTDSQANRQAIAKEIIKHKTAGCDYADTPTSATSVTENVEINGTSYAVKFCKPALTEAAVAITVTNIGYTGNTLVADIQSAISGFFATKVGVGTSVSVYDIVSYVYNAVNGIHISTITIGGQPSVTAYGYTKIVPSSITVTVS